MDKARLLRLVCDGDGEWWPDLRQKADGRGKYLCMEERCLRRLNDRQVQRIFPGSVRQLLLSRIHDAIGKRVQEMMHRLRGCTLLGKDAVLQALWQTAPLVIVVAQDASSGLRERVAMAVEKQQQATTQLLQAGSVAEFGALYGRDRLAVMAWKKDALSEKLITLMAWQQRVTV